MENLFPYPLPKDHFTAVTLVPSCMTCLFHFPWVFRDYMLLVRPITTECWCKCYSFAEVFINFYKFWLFASFAEDLPKTMPHALFLSKQWQKIFHEKWCRFSTINYWHCFHTHSNFKLCLCMVQTSSYLKLLFRI
jgi:hypothetical protein